MEAATERDPLLNVVACSYEGLAFGWDVFRAADREHDSDVSFHMAFGFNLGGGVVKCCDISESGRYLVTGSTDERIRMFNLNTRTAVGELNSHNGAVTAVKFFRDSHMISASEDNSLCIWRTHDWSCLHVLGGHKDAVHDVAIHPSGKLAISVSKDRTMRTWDLLNGRSAYITRLKAASPPDRVGWSPLGRYYYVILCNQVQVHDTVSGELVVTLCSTMRVNQARLIPAGGAVEDADQEEVVVVLGGDDGFFRFHGIDGELLHEVNCKQLLGGRVKDFTLVDVKGNDAEEEKATYLVSASSVGIINIWDLQRLMTADDPSDALVHSQKIKGEPRFTCLTAWSPTTAPERVKRSNNRKKRPRQRLQAATEGHQEEAQDKEEEPETKPHVGKKARAKKQQQKQQKQKLKQQLKKSKASNRS